MGLQYFVAILVILCFLADLSTGLSSEPLVFSATLMSHAEDPIVRSWTASERNIANEVLLFWSTESQSGEENVLAVSRERLTDAEFEAALNAWQTLRPHFGYLYLSCSSKDGKKSDCMCTRYNLTRSRNDGLNFKPADVITSSNWTMVSMSQCESLPPLTSQVFRDFEGVKVLVLDKVAFERIDRDAFKDLVSLELVRFSDFSVMQPDAIPEGLFCGLQYLCAIQIYGSQKKQNHLNTVIRLFKCNTMNLSNGSYVASIIDLQNLPLSQIKKELFASVNTQFLYQILLSNNSIHSIDIGAFEHFSAVGEMDLSQNQLTNLKPEIFSQMYNLSDLNLAYNMIETLDVSAFNGLNNLLLLNLSGNLIFQVEGCFNVLPNLQWIDFGFNRFDHVGNGTFGKSKSLNRLSLRGNRISYIDKSAFIGSDNLWDLNLSDNLLSNESNIKEFLQHQLPGLIQLDLGKNNITRLIFYMFSEYRPIPGTFTLIYRLNAIYLDSNAITFIDRDAFSYNPSLQVLFLGNNKLTWLDPRTFSTNVKLYALFLEYNFLESLPIMPDSLKKLYLTSNRIEHLPLINKTMPNLDTLNLFGNNLRQLDEFSFAQLPALKVLNASNCSLTEISGKTFLKHSKLQFLDLSLNQLDINFTKDYIPLAFHFAFLNLSHNRVRSIENLFLNNFRFAYVIDISNNPLVRFPSRTFGKEIRTKTLLMRNCSLQKIYESALETATRIDTIDLASNDLREFSPLKIPESASHYQVKLDDNPIQCSCRMRWLTEEQYTEHYVVPFCHKATTGTVVQFSSLTKEDFLCCGREICPVELSQCNCCTENENQPPSYLNCSNIGFWKLPSTLQPSFTVIHFEGNALTSITKDPSSMKLENVEKLYLDNNKITDIELFSFTNFPNLLLLDLSGNRLTHIQNETFAGLKMLKWLYLDNNLITEIDLAIEGFRFLNVLTLHSNSLERLSRNNMDVILSLDSLVSLTLHDNPWSCECDNATFKNWIQKNLKIVRNFADIFCSNGTALLTMNDEALLCYDLQKNVVADQYFTGPLVSSCIVSGLLLLTFVLVYEFRYVFQVLLYAVSGLRRQQNEKEDCLFDAIAVYDSSNASVRQWILNQFLHHLEPKFRIFICDRDMLPGTNKNSELVKAIKLSRRTIIVISVEALKDREIQFVLEVAYHRVRLERSSHRLMLVLFDGMTYQRLRIGDEIDSNFKAYLTKHKCLSVDDRLFWQKLNYFMPSPRSQPSSVNMNEREFH